MEEILFEHPSDNDIWNSSYRGSTNPRQAYRRAYEAQSRRFKAEDQIANNTVAVDQRSGSRFNPNGEGGVPVSKLKRKQESICALEEQARKHYAEFVAFSGFETEAGRAAAANLGNLLGYSVRTGNEFSAYIRSAEAKERFMKG
jgi:hypothetical protein